MKTVLFAGVILLGAFGVVLAQTTQPATQPDTQATDHASSELDRLLRPDAAPSTVLQPAAQGQQDRTTGIHAVAPGAPVLNVMREGTLVVDRVGRIQRSADGQQMEFVFDADGKAMQDPPVILLPNLKLMAIENELSRSDHALRLRISGSVTEYRGRNYILLDKVVVVPDAR